MQPEHQFSEHVGPNGEQQVHNIITSKKKNKSYVQRQTSQSCVHSHKSSWQLQYQPRKRKGKKRGRYVHGKKRHSTSNNRARELEAAVLIPCGLSHHNDYLFLTNGNSNLLILWLHFCGLTFHMSQETSASTPWLNPPLVKLITCVAHKRMVTCKHIASDGLNPAYPQNKRESHNHIFTYAMRLSS